MKHTREDYNRRIQDSEGKIPEDEPVFLLRAQDKIAPEVVARWVELAEYEKADPNIIRAARAQVQAMLVWQYNHGSKVPDL